MPAMTERTGARVTVRGSVVAALALTAILLWVGFCTHRYAVGDLGTDRGAVRHWVAGHGLYAYRDPVSHLGTAIPPPAAFLLRPAAYLPLALVGWLVALAGVAALVLATIALAGPVARRYGRARWVAVLVAVGVGLTVEPVRATLGLGHLDLVLFGLVTADVVALRRGAWARSRAAWWPGRAASVPPRDRPLVHLLHRGWATGAWAGVGVGLATALAVGPGVFIVYLALTRQWRAALTALGTALTLAAGALLTAPQETAAWFDEVLWRLDRTGGVAQAGNQSLAGVLARLYDSATTPVLLWLSFALLLVAVGMIRARSAHADGDEIAAFTVVGLTGAVVGPVTGTHELVWVLPAILIMVDAGARRRSTARRPVPGRNRRYPGAGHFAAAAATYLLFVLAPVWTVSGVIGANAYALAMILLVNALPWRPGVAPAYPVNRWLGTGRPRVIPPARRPMGS